MKLAKHPPVPNRRAVVSVSFRAHDFQAVATAAALQGETMTGFVRAAALGAAARELGGAAVTMTTSNAVTFRKKP